MHAPVAVAAVESFDEPVLHRFIRLDDAQFHALLFGPVGDRGRDELGAIIKAELQRIASPGGNALQHPVRADSDRPPWSASLLHRGSEMKSPEQRELWASVDKSRGLAPVATSDACPCVAAFAPGQIPGEELACGSGTGPAAGSI